MSWDLSCSPSWMHNKVATVIYWQSALNYTSNTSHCKTHLSYIPRLYKCQIQSISGHKNLKAQKKKEKKINSCTQWGIPTIFLPEKKSFNMCMGYLSSIMISRQFRSYFSTHLCMQKPGIYIKVFQSNITSLPKFDVKRFAFEMGSYWSKA